MLFEFLKIKYLYIKAFLTSILNKKVIKVSSQKLCFIMLAADYNNLGDIAITKAQETFLKKLLPDYEFVIVFCEDTFKVYRDMKKKLNRDSIITLIGGGNSGSLYEFIEWPRRFILKKFKKNKIISFPQSVFYDNTKKGILYQKEFKKLCCKCKNIILCAREIISFEKYKKIFGTKIRIILVPDIVFTLNVSKNNSSSGICFIMRNDKEKAVDFSDENKLIDIISKKYKDVSICDTCLVNVSENWYNELESFINKIRMKKLIITDRLHGMILSYICNVPCIVFDNNNNKISSTYFTWLSDCSNIKLLNPNDYSNICSIINELLDTKVNNLSLEPFYNELKNIIIEEKNE